MLGAEDMRIIRRIMEHKGLIDEQVSSDARKVFPNGDRRKGLFSGLPIKKYGG